MAIPAIGGAGVLEGYSLLKDGNHALETPYGYLAIGAALSFVVGLGAIWLLERLLKHGRLHWFAWYCIALGIVVVGWQLFAR